MNAASLVTMNENVLAAIDVETTGLIPWYHEIVQVAVVPLDYNIKPVGRPFYSNIRPVYPDRIAPDAIDTHEITLAELEQYPDPTVVADSLYDWFKDLSLVPGKRLIPLAHNCQFDVPFLQTWLGFEQFNEIFGYPTRDTQSIISGIMDRAAYKGHAIPFKRASLEHACEVLGVPLDDAHDALADAIATAEVYRLLLKWSSW